jgi:glutamate formiminotransferase/formiminotetrahydrofolate cyclodeaminase
VNLAKILAACLRESGNTGLIHTVLQPRRLQSVKAIGWFLEDFGIAQVSMNLTDIEQTPIHEVFDVACALALELGLRITGSEIVGLVPKQALLDAGAYFLRKQGDIEIKTETELLTIAIKTLGLSELSVFDPAKKIIEIVMNE